MIAKPSVGKGGWCAQEYLFVFEEGYSANLLTVIDRRNYVRQNKFGIAMSPDHSQRSGSVKSLATRD